MALPPEEVAKQMAHISDNKQPNIIASVGILISFCYIAVGLRLWARRKVGAKLMADDYWALIALFVVSGYAAANIVVVHYGLGRHLILLKDPRSFGKSVLACPLIYTFCIPPSKLSLLYLYHRIFLSKKLMWWSIGTGVFVVLSAIAQFMAMLMQCFPLSSIWTGIPANSCIDFTLMVTIFSCFNVATDIIVLILPMPSLWKLKVSTGVKAGLVGTFALGGAVCIFGMIRIYMVRSASYVDVTWSYADGAMWSVIESHIGLISACLPCLRPLFYSTQRERTEASGKTSYTTSATNHNSKSGGIALSSRLKAKMGSHGATGRVEREALATTDSGFERLVDMENGMRKDKFANKSMVTSEEVDDGVRKDRAANKIVVTSDVNQEWQENRSIIK